MATYNGEAYIAPQINSIINQSYTNWELLIRDDGSTDNTINIVNNIIKKDSRIKLINDQKTNNAGACGNFSNLIECALRKNYDFYFFSDQDDIWNANKMELQLQKAKLIDPNIPYLVHHDLEVVDSQQHQLSPSFFKFMRLSPQKIKFQSLLGRNEVTGCTISCNRALLLNASPIPAEAVMHDWWLALCAEAIGKIEVIDDQLIKYRQHKHNTIGAKSFWHGLNPLTNWIKGWKRGNEEFRLTLVQANALKLKLEEKFISDPVTNNTIYESISIYSDITKFGPFKRISIASRYGLLNSFWFIKLISIIRLLTIKKSR